MKKKKPREQTNNKTTWLAAKPFHVHRIARTPQYTNGMDGLAMCKEGTSTIAHQY